MVVDCSKCGEYAYATRYKDSFLSFCRACGYWRDPDKGEGQYDVDELAEMRERWDITTEYEEQR